VEKTGVPGPHALEATMTIDKNNPDGQGSYGKTPSLFVARPKEKANLRTNDATAAPMGHSGEEQEGFDEAQRKQAQPQNPPAGPLASKPVPKPPLHGKDTP